MALAQASSSRQVPDMLLLDLFVNNNVVNVINVNKLMS